MFSNLHRMCEVGCHQQIPISRSETLSLSGSRGIQWIESRMFNLSGRGSFQALVSFFIALNYSFNWLRYISETRVKETRLRNSKQTEYREKFVEWPIAKVLYSHLCYHYVKNYKQKEHHGSSATNPLGITGDSAAASTWKSESHIATEKMLTTPSTSKPAAGIYNSESASELATAKTQIFYSQGI